MSYTPVLLYLIAGMFYENSSTYVSDQKLGGTQFVTYVGTKGCAVHFQHDGGDDLSWHNVTPNIDESVNHHYVGLNSDGTASRMTYWTQVGVMPHDTVEPGEVVLLKQSTNFTVEFESRVEAYRVKKIVSCDASSCTCTVKS